MKMFLVAFGFIAMLGFSQATAATLPPEFTGVWTAAMEAENQCRRSDWNGDRTDRLISVSPSQIQYWETSCKVDVVRKLDDGAAEVDLFCSGEGETWRSKELFHVQKIGSSRQLVSVSLKRFDERDQARRPIKNRAPQKMYVIIYLECK